MKNITISTTLAQSILSDLEQALFAFFYEGRQAQIVETLESYTELYSQFSQDQINALDVATPESFLGKFEEQFEMTIATFMLSRTPGTEEYLRAEHTFNIERLDSYVCSGAGEFDVPHQDLRLFAKVVESYDNIINAGFEPAQYDDPEFYAGHLGIDANYQTILDEYDQQVHA